MVIGMRMGGNGGTSEREGPLIQVTPTILHVKTKLGKPTD